MDDGVEPTKAFIRRGRKESAVQHETKPLLRLKDRRAASELERYSNKRKIEEMLNDDEKLDPDLVAFWGIEDDEAQAGDQVVQGQLPSLEAVRSKRLKGLWRSTPGGDNGGGVW